MQDSQEKHPKSLLKVNSKATVSGRQVRQSTLDQRKDRLLPIDFPSPATSEENITLKDCSVRLNKIAVQPTDLTRRSSLQESINEISNLGDPEQTIIQQPPAPETLSVPSSTDNIVEEEELARLEQHLLSIEPISPKKTNNDDRSEQLERTSAWREYLALREFQEEIDNIDTSDEFKTIPTKHLYSTPKATSPHRSVHNDNNYIVPEETTTRRRSTTRASFLSESVDTHDRNFSASFDNTMAEGKLMTIEPFEGRASQKVCEFLQLYEFSGKRRKMEDEELVSNLVDYLRGEAALWYIETYKDNKDKKTFEEIRREMFARFGTLSGMSKIRSELRNRYQQEDEQVGEYVRDILRLCGKLNTKMTEEDKIDYIKVNLLRRFQDEVVPFNDTTTAELLTRLVAIENNLDLMPLTKAKPDVSNQARKVSFHQDEDLVAKLNGLEQKIQQMMTQANQSRNFTAPNRFPQRRNDYPPMNPYRFTSPNYQMPNSTRYAYQPFASQPTYQPQRRVRLPDGRPVCDHCGIPGHIMRTCRRLNMTQNPTESMRYPNRINELPQIDSHGETSGQQGKD